MPEEWGALPSVRTYEKKRKRSHDIQELSQKKNDNERVDVSKNACSYLTPTNMRNKLSTRRCSQEDES
jgi:hypothetical protein